MSLLKEDVLKAFPGVNRRLDLVAPYLPAAAAFAVAIVITVLRRPDVITAPQFWAEDGRFWYQSAHNIGGLAPLLTPMNGYFQTFSRLVAALSQLVPLAFAPLFFNLAALAAKALPVAFAFTPRFRRVVPSLGAVVALSAAFLLLPNTHEVHANVTNAHTYLALLAFMTVMAPAPRTAWGKAWDAAVFLLSGLSGPFVIFLLPVALAASRRDGWRACAARLLPMAMAASVQLASLATASAGARSQAALGATPLLLGKIAAVQVYLGTVLGSAGTSNLSGILGTADFAVFLALAGFSGTAIIIRALLRGPRPLKLFIVFASLVFGAALLSPMASLKDAQWPLLAVPGSASRYWFFPMLAFLASAGWLAASRRDPWRPLGLAVVALALAFLPWNFRFEPWPDREFIARAAAYERLAPGQHTVIPIMPPGWTMELVKR
jgi:hypothetical protein